MGIYKCMVDLAVYPPAAILKVDDTAPGIAEGGSVRGNWLVQGRVVS